MGEEQYWPTWSFVSVLKWLCNKIVFFFSFTNRTHLGPWCNRPKCFAKSLFFKLFQSTPRWVRFCVTVHSQRVALYFAKPISQLSGGQVVGSIHKRNLLGKSTWKKSSCLCRSAHTQHCSTFDEGNIVWFLTTFTYLTTTFKPMT